MKFRSKPNVLDMSFHSKKVKQTKNERLFINNIYFNNSNYSGHYLSYESFVVPRAELQNKTVVLGEVLKTNTAEPAKLCFC